jgi:DtxR family Mn-dependent transcriptional regulator
MPSSTVEDYLKAIHRLERAEPGGRVATGQIAAALGLTPGAVTAKLQTLAEGGLVTYAPYSGVVLTEMGRRIALHVLRRHRLVELFLVRVMGLDWTEVHDEAERLEHAVSDRLIARIDEMLGHPGTDPHGDPIPDADGVVEEPRLVSLLECETGREQRIARVDDHSAPVLQEIDRLGLRPGVAVRVERRDAADGSLLLTRDDGGAVEVDRGAAGAVFVAQHRG